MSFVRAARPQRVGVPVEVPAPILGWNTRDGLASMDPRFAIKLDNWFPDDSSVNLRRGTSEQATIDAVAKTLFAFDFQGTQKLLAFTDDKIIDVTSSSTVDKATGLTEGFWSTTMMGGHGIFVNGADTPRKYDGSTVSTTTFTGSGLTATDLYGVHNHKSRLFFWENNATSFWYSSTNAISGTLNEFDLQYVANVRGKVAAMGSWTFDGGAGVDDVLCIFTDLGQVFIYSGSDPGDATDWALVGIFHLGARLLGRRCVEKYGGDLIVMTQNGYFPLSKALALGNVSDAVTVSDAINSVPTKLARDNPNAEYWQVFLRGTASMLLFNVPSDSNYLYDQHVMNTRTGAWCRFKAWDANHFVEHAGGLYFAHASETKVFQADTGTDDDSADILAECQQAFTNLGIPHKKRWTQLRPIIQVTDGIDVGLGLAVDYGEAPSVAPISSVGVAGVEWDSAEAVWDEADWAGDVTIQRAWQGISGVGFVGSTILKVQTQAQEVQWHSTTHLVEPGGPI